MGKSQTTMIKLMLGTNFDSTLPHQLERLTGAGVRIEEVYGSTSEFKLFGSARPDFRLPRITLKELEDQVMAYGIRGIKVNYTENTPIVDKKNIIVDSLKLKLEILKSIGISRLTLAHPLAMELVCEYSNLPIEISTIYAVRNAYQLRVLKGRYPNINKVCVDVDINRDFRTLGEVVKQAEELNIEVELLANEFCIFDCVDRVQCYNEHVQVRTDAETSRFGRYPMGRCINTRQNPLEWMRARFILPQHMRWYQSSLKINNFKITGRTHPTKYILWIAEQYLNMNYEGNLLELWADVKNIKRVGKGEQDFLPPNIDIPASQFKESFLWDYWEHPEYNSDYNKEIDYLSKYSYT